MILDISWPLDENTPSFPGDPNFSSHRVATIEERGYALTSLRMGAHMGTHVDAPSHFYPDGMTIDQVPLELLFGPARVLDARGRGPNIDRELLESTDLGGVTRLLLRTDNEKLDGQRFDPAHVALSVEGARFLRTQTRVRLIGIDYLSIERASDDFPVHHVLLAEPDPIIIVELIDLRGVEAGDYRLAVLPLRVSGVEAAPARAVLV